MLALGRLGLGYSPFLSLTVEFSLTIAGVRIRAAVDFVDTSAADDIVVAFVAAEHVVSTAAIDRIVSKVAPDGVVTVVALDSVDPYASLSSSGSFHGELGEAIAIALLTRWFHRCAPRYGRDSLWGTVTRVYGRLGW